MTSLTLCVVVLGGWFGGAESARDSPPMPAYDAIEGLRKDSLGYVRERIRFAERMIPREEQTAVLEELNGLPDRAEARRERVRQWREDLKKLKRRERELWEQQPGGITAPPPRPKGTPLRPAAVRD